jgi:hypothetical protein
MLFLVGAALVMGWLVRDVPDGGLVVGPMLFGLVLIAFALVAVIQLVRGRRWWLATIALLLAVATGGLALLILFPVGVVMFDEWADDNVNRRTERRRRRSSST